MVAVVALIAAVATTPFAIAIARRTDLVDRPGPLKVHERPVPYLGGVGIAAALVVGLVGTRPTLLVPFGGAFVLGVLDDKFDLSPALRLAGEAGVGAAIGLFLPLWHPSVLGVLFAIALTVALCNAVNMVDGLDGLAGGVTLVAAIGFHLVLSGDAATIALALSVGIAGFLAFNLPPAAIYLGDGGAYLVGAALSALFVLTCRPGSGASFDIALLFVGYPLVELVFAMVRRAATRTSALEGDRQHMYDQLHARGASSSTASLVCVLLQGALVVAGTIVSRHSEEAGVYVAGGCGMMILLVGVLGGFAAPDVRRR